MLEKILVMTKRCDELAGRLRNWYNSLDSLLVTLLVLAVVIGVLILVSAALSTVFGLIMLYLPRLSTYIILTCLVVSLAIIIAGLFLQRINAGVWLIGMILSVLLMIAVGALFGFGGVGVKHLPQSINTRLFPNKVQFPISIPGGIAVDEHGRIYIAIQGYSRIQVYDKKGNFLKGWFVNTTGIFDIWLGDDSFLHAVLARASSHDVFDLNGRLLKSAEVTSNEEEYRLFEKAGGLNEQDVFGNTYSIQSSEWFPKIVKRTPTGKEFVLIKDPFHFWLIKSPQPIWIVGLVGLIIIAVLVKVIKKKVYFPQIDADACGQSLE